MIFISSSPNPIWVVAVLFTFALITSSHAVTMQIRNNCPYTVWAAARPGGGRQLSPGASWPLEVPAGTTGARIWGRTNCIFDGRPVACQTGDCNGQLVCQGTGKPPATLAEYSLTDKAYYDISLIEGFNIPMSFNPTNGGCKALRCSANINGECPAVLRAPGGCDNPCTKPNTGPCGPTGLGTFFRDRCPDAYYYPADVKTNACPNGSGYNIVFCP